MGATLERMVVARPDHPAHRSPLRDGVDPRHAKIHFHWRRYVLVVVVFALGVRFLLPHVATLSTSLDVARRLRWWALILAVVAQAWSYWGSGYLLRAVLAVSGARLSMRRAITITLAASSLGLVAGGLVGSAAVTYRWCRAAGVRADAALLAGWLPSIFNSLALVGFAALGLVHMVTLHELARWELISAAFSALVLLVIPAVVLWGLAHRTRFLVVVQRLRAWWMRRRKRTPAAAPSVPDVTQLLGAWDAMRRGGWRRPLVGSVYNIGFDMLTVYLLFVAARFPVNPGVLLAGYALPLLLGRISIFPGGLGIIEATMIALYSGLGVPATIAVLVVLSYRLLSFWLPTLIGFPLIAYLQQRLPARHAPLGDERPAGTRAT